MQHSFSISWRRPAAVKTPFTEIRANIAKALESLALRCDEPIIHRRRTHLRGSLGAENIEAGWRLLDSAAVQLSIWCDVDELTATLDGDERRIAFACHETWLGFLLLFNLGREAEEPVVREIASVVRAKLDPGRADRISVSAKGELVGVEGFLRGIDLRAVARLRAGSTLSAADVQTVAALLKLKPLALEVLRDLGRDWVVAQVNEEVFHIHATGAVYIRTPDGQPHLVNL